MAGFFRNFLGRLGVGQRAAPDGRGPPLDVHFRTDYEFVKEHADNLTNGRMFIRTRRKPEVDTVTEVQVILPSAQVLRGTARVVSPVKAPEKGVFVEFMNQDPSLLLALDRYLLSLA